MEAEDATAIGQRVRMIRRRRRMSQDVVAGLAGITKGMDRGLADGGPSSVAVSTRRR